MLGGLVSGAFDYAGGERANSAAKKMAREQMEFTHKQNFYDRSFNREQGHIQRTYNAKQAFINRQFQAEMSNTAIQRGMADMAAAGINPILAGRYPASSPGGSLASASAVQHSTATVAPSFNPRNTLGSAVNTAMTAARTQADVEKTEEETGKVKAEVQKIKEEVKNLNAARELTEAQTEQISYVILELEARANKLVEETHGIEMDNAVKEIVTEFMKSHEAAAIAKSMGLAIGAVTGIITAVLGQRTGFVRGIVRNVKNAYNRINNRIKRSTEGTITITPGSKK